MNSDSQQVSFAVLDNMILCGKKQCEEYLREYLVYKVVSP
jgi:hypothetical protein